jgi:hypothetical protein
MSGRDKTPGLDTLLRDATRGSNADLEWAGVTGIQVGKLEDVAILAGRQTAMDEICKQTPPDIDGGQGVDAIEVVNKIRTIQ